MSASMQYQRTASVWPSKRSTSTGVVLDAPDQTETISQSTRTPSMVEVTSSA
jgi:hypothetical protein